MLLCDIGNTSYHFLKDDVDFKESVCSFEPATIQEPLYYISVNQEVSAKLASLKNWVDLSAFVAWDKYYDTMGIDRIVAIEAVAKSAVIIDAGSAVTVDIVKEGRFEGGFIYPGIEAMGQTYANISDALAYSFNFDLALDIMPKNSKDAISYGYLKTLYSEVMSHNLPLILTGGNAKEFAKIFKEAVIDEELIFKGMKKIIQRADIC
jgi:type III pantothenate kinase